MPSNDIICDIYDSSEIIEDFFSENKELISLYHRIQDEMYRCDPDLKFCFRNGLIGLAKKGEKYRFYIAPAEDLYDIKFAHMDSKLPFHSNNENLYLKECENCVLHILRTPECVMSVQNTEQEPDYSTVETTLNRNQRRFCTRPSGKNIRLLAPAGSGKTFSLLWRCRYIVEDYRKKEKVPPYFLIVTFTKSACGELEERLKSTPEFKNIRATVRTLNSWGWEQIRIPNKLLITDRFERRKLVLNDLNTVITKYPELASLTKSAKNKYSNAEMIIDLIDLLKSLGFDHTMNKVGYKSHCRELKELKLMSVLTDSYAELFAALGVDGNDKKKSDDTISDFFSFWKKAVVKLQENLKFTMEDQKYWALQTLRNNIELQKFPKGVTKYTHILIDEFQDINPLDLRLINTISEYHGSGKKICFTIVGDDDQAIFGWRGTTPHYILYPDKYIGGDFETIILTENYRSSKNIVELSCRLIANNKEREPKELKSRASGKAFVKVIRRQRYYSSVEAAMRTLHELIDKKGCRNVALIGRKQAAIFPYQILLSAEGTNYTVDTDIDIFAGEAMVSLMDIIKIVYRAKDSDNDSVCPELMQVCRKISRYPMKRPDEKQLLDYLEGNHPDNFRQAMEALRTCPYELKNHDFQKYYAVLDRLISSETVYDFMRCIVEDFDGLSKDYNKSDIDSHYKEPQFFRLMEISKKYHSDLRSFWRDIDKARRNVRSSDSKVTLITATRSKGHEYDAVILLDCYDSEWPNSLAEDIEEERRLMYVAMTRAKKYLYFISSGDKEDSRFLTEMGLI